MVPAWVTRRPSLTEPRPERPRALQSSGHPGVSTRLINFRYYLRVLVVVYVKPQYIFMYVLLICIWTHCIMFHLYINFIIYI